MTLCIGIKVRDGLIGMADTQVTSGSERIMVSAEDKAAIESAGLYFDLAALVGGQLERDDEHKLYLIYPQGNWVEVTEGTPHFSIGEGGYAKPLLDRALRYETSLEDALKIAYLAFDATLTSSTTVDFPLDLVLCGRGTCRAVQHRFERDDLKHVSEWWQKRLRDSIDECPSDWLEGTVSQTDAKIVPLDPASGAD
jgi:putative proteasome-type protease